MKHIKCILLISTCCLLTNVSNAEINLTLDASDISLISNPTLHTHHTPVELKPISVSNGIKLAATCFLPDCSANGDGFPDNSYDLDTQYLCNNEGYNLTSCTIGKIPQDFCPHDSRYFKSCKCNDEFQYTASSCKTSYPNSVLGSEQCSSEGATYSNSCVCDAVKYSYTTSNCNGNESLSGTICKSSNGISYGSACICTPTAGKCNGYNLSSNNCTGGYSIGESCHDGCNTKWRCKDLCPYKGTLSSCPNGYVCTLEECSSKFYISGCRVGDIDIEKCSWYSCWMNVFSK